MNGEAMTLVTSDRKKKRFFFLFFFFLSLLNVLLIDLLRQQKISEMERWVFIIIPLLLERSEKFWGV